MLVELRVYLLVCAAVLGHPVLCGGGYPSDHTMVRYPGPLLECDSKQVMAGFSLDMQEFIVDLHNELRHKHETDKFGIFHSGLSELTWNDELATIAQRWANQCKFGNDGNRATMDGSSVGQYVYLGYRGRNSAEVTIKDTGENYDVLVDLGNIHTKVSATEKAWNLLKPITHGTVGVLNDENSEFDKVQTLLSGSTERLLLDSDVMEVLGNPNIKVTKGDVTVEMMSKIEHVPCVFERDGNEMVVEVGSDDGDCSIVATAEHVPCIVERQGKDVVVEVGIDSDCGEVTFDMGTIDININVELGTELNLIQEVEIEEIETILVGSGFETTLGESFQEILETPRTLTKFDIGKISIEKPEVDLKSPLKTAVSSWFKSAITSWFTEVTPPGGKDYILADSIKFTMPDGLEVSQLLYSRTSELGCGASVYKEQDYPGWDYVLLVCNYLRD